jgi:hypothetical protein
MIKQFLPLSFTPLRDESLHIAKRLHAQISFDEWPGIDGRTLHGAIANQLRDLNDPKSRDHWVRWAETHDKRWQAFRDEENEDWVSIGPNPDCEGSDDFYWQEGCESKEDAQYCAENNRKQWWHLLRDDYKALYEELRTLEDRRESSRYVLPEGSPFVLPV